MMKILFIMDAISIPTPRNAYAHTAPHLALFANATCKVDPDSQLAISGILRPNDVANCADLKAKVC